MIPLIIAGVMVLGSLMGSKKDDNNAKIANIAAKSDAKVKNIARMADNQMRAAKDSLSRYQQSQSNKFKLLSGGEQLSAQATNLLRLGDESVRGSLERRIAVSEEAGALAARAGAAGIGGGSLDMVSRANIMRTQRVDEMHRVVAEQQSDDGKLAMEQTMRAVVLGLDDTQFDTSLNFMESVASKTPRVDWGAAAVEAGMKGMQAYSSMGGSMPGAKAPTTQLPQQSPAAWAPQQSPAVSTSPFGSRPAPTIRMK